MEFEVFPNVEQSLDFLRIFFTDKIINQIITETNNYAATKLEVEDTKQPIIAVIVRTNQERILVNAS